MTETVETTYYTLHRNQYEEYKKLAEESEVSIDYFEEDLDLIDVLECREFCTKEESKEDCGIEWEKTEKTMNDILNITDPVRLEANKLLNDLNNSINNC